MGYYEQPPYFYNDTSQRAIKNLINTSIMLISESDIRWWLSQRDYDYSYINVFDRRPAKDTGSPPIAIIPIPGV